MSYLSLREVADILKDISYKDWNIGVQPGEGIHNDYPYAYLTARVINSWNPTEKVKVGNSIPLYGCSRELDVVRRIFDMVQDMEMHEVREFYRYKGEIIYDPHRNEKNGK